MALGMNPQNWSRLETGNASFDQDEIFMYAAFFGVDPAWLLTGREINHVSLPSMSEERERATVDLPESNVIRAPDGVDIMVAPESLPVVGAAAADETAGRHPGVLPEDAGRIWEDVIIPRSSRMVKVIGDSMSPVILGGQYAIIGEETVPPAVPRNRDIVMAEVADGGSGQPGSVRRWEGVYCKRVADAGASWLFTSINVTGKPFTVQKRNCRLWPVIGVWFAGQGVPPEED